MNLIKQIEDFFGAIDTDPRIGTTHIALYAALLHLRMRKGEEPLIIYSYTVMPVAKICGLGTYHKTIKELHEYGYVKYEPSLNRRGSRVYFNSQ